MFNSNACVTNCPLCVTWVPRAGSPEDGEASGFSPVLCTDCAAPLQWDLLPFQILPGTKRWFCHGCAVSRRIRIPRSQPQTCWGCGGCSPLPGAVLGGDRGCVCLQGASRRGGAGPQSTSQSQLAESLQQGLHAAAGGEDPWPLPRLQAECTAPFYTWAASRDIHGLGVPRVVPTTSFPPSETPQRGWEC